MKRLLAGLAVQSLAALGVAAFFTGVAAVAAYVRAGTWRPDSKWLAVFVFALLAGALGGTPWVHGADRHDQLMQATPYPAKEGSSFEHEAHERVVNRGSVGTTLLMAGVMLAFIWSRFW